MTPACYTSDVSRLTDAEIAALRKEIEDAGILSDDSYDYEAGSWEQQAYDRYDALWAEADRRRELANPEEAKKYRQSFLTLTAQSEIVRRTMTNPFIFGDGMRAMTQSGAPAVISEKDYRMPFFFRSPFDHR